MEPLVIVGAVVVLFYGYHTVMDIVRDVEEDGSFDVVAGCLAGWHAGCFALRQRLHRAGSGRLHYYGTFFQEAKKRQRSVLLKRHA